jgi:hypothetical protein
VLTRRPSAPISNLRADGDLGDHASRSAARTLPFCNVRRFQTVVAEARRG